MGLICLDSSILIEIARDNPKFITYADKEFYITDLTLAEFCGVVLREHNEKTSDYWFRKFRSFARPLSAELFYVATKFRWKEKNKKLSYPDAVAYCSAREQNCKLITSDGDFRNLPGAELVTE